MKDKPLLAFIAVLCLASCLLALKYFGAVEGETVSANGTVRYIPLEGGFYGIETDKGEKYLPLNLPEEYKKDGLKVWFRGRPKKTATAQMWGTPVEILEIKKIPESQKIPESRTGAASKNISGSEKPEREREETPGIGASPEETVKSLLEEIENITKELEGVME